MPAAGARDERRLPSRRPLTASRHHATPDADDARAYLASTPRRHPRLGRPPRGAPLLRARRRRARPRGGARRRRSSRCRRRARARSARRETASGETCPTINPRVAPLNRPSVTRATESPRPRPTIADVIESISGMPGAPGRALAADDDDLARLHDAVVDRRLALRLRLEDPGRPAMDRALVSRELDDRARPARGCRAGRAARRPA